MRLTALLRRQHIGFMFKRHWLLASKRVPVETGVEEHLTQLGIPVVDAVEFVRNNGPPRPTLKIVGLYDPPLPLDENHPDYKEVPCHILRDTTVLLEGISQAQVLTKTVICEGTLPNKIEELSQIEIPDAIHECVKKSILSANVYDSEQAKLPKIKDPARPAFNFPRILGISDVRKNVILNNKILQIIERSSDAEATATKYVANDVRSRLTYEKDSDLLQFQELSNVLVTSVQPLRYEVSKKENVVDIPDLYPIKHTVTMPKEHFYDSDSSYPIKSSVAKRHPHTTWLHFNRTQISNIYETPVTHKQELGRALVHAFTVAASYAKQTYGDDVKELPEPVFLNCIQSDGQIYHLGVLELRTLDLDGVDGIKNTWYTIPDLKLYGKCEYVGAIPVLENYNPDVFSYINAMYNS